MPNPCFVNGDEKYRWHCRSECADTKPNDSSHLSFRITPACLKASSTEEWTKTGGKCPKCYVNCNLCNKTISKKDEKCDCTAPRDDLPPLPVRESSQSDDHDSDSRKREWTEWVECDWCGTTRRIDVVRSNGNICPGCSKFKFQSWQ